MVRIVEDVQPGWHRILFVPADIGDILGLNSVWLEPLGSIAGFADGFGGGGDVEHPGRPSARRLVDPSTVSDVGTPGEPHANGDMSGCCLDDRLRTTLG
ncbi:hypothetical protein [Haloplanus litoreus]|uniref:Uncharacterized protein n=2 Tax=Haloplanus litoreus TaxID=767515 RepID=A0ABD6A3D9_9EURY